MGDVDGVDAVGNHTVACEGLPDIAFAYGNHCDGFLVRIGSYLKAAVHISDKGKINLGYIPAVEVFEADCSAVNKIGYVSEDFIAVASFLADNGAFTLILLLIRVKIPQIAGDVCVIGIFGTCKQGTVVKSATGHLHLPDMTVRCEAYLFCTALSAELIAVGRTMIEDIPLSVDFLDTSVIVAVQVGKKI